MTKQAQELRALASRIRYTIAIAMGALLIFVSTIPRLSTPAFYAQRSNWKGYFTVVVEPGQNTRNLDMAGSVTRYTAWVNVSVIDGLERVAIADIHDRLIEEDPRYDPYLSSVSGYFAAGEEEIVYLPDRVPAWAVPLILIGDGMRIGSFRVAEWRTVTNLFLMIFVGIPALIVYLRSQNPTLLIALLPISLLGQAGTWGLVVGLVLAILLISYHRGVSGFFLALVRREKYPVIRARKVAMVAIASILGALALLPLHPRPGIALASYLLSAGGCLGAALLWAGVVAENSHRRGHVIFDPIPLIRRAARSPGWRLAVCLATVVLVASVSYVDEHRRRSELPAPIRSQGSVAYDWVTLSDLYHSAEVRILPGIADFFCHVTYQNYLPYGRSYQFPEYGEIVSIGTFDLVGDRIVRRERQVALLDSGWYASVFSVAREEPLAAMLLTQTRPVAVERNPGVTFRGVARAVGFTSLALGIIAAGVLFRPNLTAGTIYGMRKTQHRRKQLIA